MEIVANLNRKNLILAGLILVFGVSVIIFLYQFSAPKKGAAEERVVVNLTTTEAELIPKLKQQGYIRSEWFFNFALKIKNWQGKIKPGGYEVSKSMNVWKLAEILVNHPYQKWAAVPEGLRKEEVADIIQNKIGWSDSEKEKFIKDSQEGYLFPDTYLFDLSFSAEDAIKRMMSNFNEKTADLIKEAKVKNIRNDTLIVLASLIQREAANEKEMPLIASVIWNRWLEGMPFQIDATVQYALGEPGNWWRKIKPGDYKINSPYNTYIHQGSPLAPICNPGLAAIDAVINPEKTDYLYYLHDSAGQIHPAKTYKGHLGNIEKYLK